MQSAVTGARLDRIPDDPLVGAFATRCMREAAAIGARIAYPSTPAERHAAMRLMGAARTSMLQDVEAGRAVELDALETVVAELAGALAIPTPDIDTLLGPARLHARSHGLNPVKASSDVPVR